MRFPVCLFGAMSWCRDIIFTSLANAQGQINECDRPIHIEKESMGLIIYTSNFVVPCFVLLAWAVVSQNPLTFTPSRSPDNARRPQVWPVSLSQRGTITRKINRARPKSDQFWSWSVYISMQNRRTLSPCIRKEIPRNLNFDPFH